MCAYSRERLFVEMDLRAFQNKVKDNRLRKKKHLKTEVVGKLKQKIGLVVLAEYATVANDFKFTECWLQKLEEKKRVGALSRGVLNRGIAV